uniref:FLYWCH-type domain-containing protein n=1 Tax=Rhodnius prolixus TaxID=13249 RepID=T1IA64_RHOPR
MEFIPSNKGHVKVLYNNYMYTKHKCCGKGIRWRCVERMLNCKGSITTTYADDPPVMTINHNHLPDLNAVKEAKAKVRARHARGVIDEIIIRTV